MKGPAILAAALLLSALWPLSAAADSITGLRSFSNADKTRVVLDLDFRPDYSTSFNEAGDTFIIRVRRVGNAREAQERLDFEQRSAVRGLRKVLDRSDVRYIFSLEGAGTPRAFVLEPQDGFAYRLVIDFPHTSTERQAGSTEAPVTVLDRQAADSRRGTGSGSGTPPVNVITVREADAAEQELLRSLSTVGRDGIRTMTPAQAAAYAERRRELARQQAAARAAEQPEVVQEVTAPPAPVAARGRTNAFIIAVDAGHGGKDPGAIGKRGVKEKDVTLAVATALVSYINSNAQFRGTLTRDKDVYIDLDRRSELARTRRADILISIHADSVASGNKARGASVWVLSNQRAQRENKKILKQGSKTSTLLGGAGDVLTGQNAQNPYLAATILDMSSDSTRSSGQQLAQEILDQLGKFTRLHNTKPIPASLAVLKSPDIPSLLIETGFLSNQYEEIQLNQPNYQKQLAYAIYQGIRTYYEKYPAQMIRSRQESESRTQAASQLRVHRIVRGDTLSKIARQYGVSVEALRRQNQLQSDVLRIGQELRIPAR